MDVRGEQEVTVATEDRGFASMDPEKQRAIARKGGRAAHEKGTAHEWTSEEARRAGRKGGLMSHQRRRERKAQENESGSEMGSMSAPAE
jgi:general stress protein YciG